MTIPFSVQYRNVRLPYRRYQRNCDLMVLVCYRDLRMMCGFRFHFLHIFF